MGSRDPVIVGVGSSDSPRTPHLDYIQHHSLAMQRALADCGLPLSAIDGYASAGDGPHGYSDHAMSMAEYFGIRYRYLDGTMVGGSSFEYHVQHAMAAIRDGRCDTVLITYGSDRLSRLGRTLGTGFHGAGDRVGGPSQYEAPYGLPLIGAYAMAAQRHMHEFGTTSEQLAAIAVGVREHAAFNPDAMFRDPLTVDDVLSSRMIADPLHKLDCCVVSDGGGAIVITTEERARDLDREPVRLLGAGTAQSHWNPSQMPDFTRTAAVEAAAAAFGEAGVSAGRHRHDPALRQLHDHGVAAARGPRVLRQGRGGNLRRLGGPAPRRLAADEHRRRRPLGLPSGHARHLLADRGGTPAAR